MSGFDIFAIVFVLLVIVTLFAGVKTVPQGYVWTIERFGLDRNGRRLATIRIGDTDVGDILIAEHLARSWPDGDEWWCRP